MSAERSTPRCLFFPAYCRDVAPETIRLALHIAMVGCEEPSVPNSRRTDNSELESVAAGWQIVSFPRTGAAT